MVLAHPKFLRYG